MNSIDKIHSAQDDVAQLQDALTKLQVGPVEADLQLGKRVLELSNVVLGAVNLVDAVHVATRSVSRSGAQRRT